MVIRGVLFDWGDTLFVSPDAVTVIVKAARERGVPISEPDARALWDEIWELGKGPDELAKGRDLSLEAHRDIWTALFRRADTRVVTGLAEVLYDEVMVPSRWVPFPDTLATLRALKERGVKVGIVSNVPRDLAPVFALHGMADLVDSYTLSFQHGLQKPARELFVRACRALGTAPAETLMVGDHPVADGRAAEAGLQVHILPRDHVIGTARGLAQVIALVDSSSRG